MVETLIGLTTIRAFGQEGYFIQSYDDYYDSHMAINMCANLVNRWLNVRVEVIGTIFVFVVSVGVALQHAAGNLSVSSAGLCLVYSLTLTKALRFGVKVSSEAEVQMNAVERVQYFISVAPEGGEMPQDTPVGWPTHGQIEFDNVSIQYPQGLGPAVDRVSFTVSPGHRVGVCGRTGSGKSSLCMALLRGQELSSGRILIDGINIATLSLSFLRAT